MKQEGVYGPVEGARGGKTPKTIFDLTSGILFYQNKNIAILSMHLGIKQGKNAKSEA